MAVDAEHDAQPGKLSGAARADKRLLTFTLETEVRSAQPDHVHAFTEELAAAMGPGGRAL